MIARLFGRGGTKPDNRNRRSHPRYSIPGLIVTLKKPYISGSLENISKGGLLVRISVTNEVFPKKTLLSVRKGHNILLVDVAVEFVRTKTVKINDKEYFLIGFKFVDLTNFQKSKLDELFEEIDRIGVDVWSRK